MGNLESVETSVYDDTNQPCRSAELSTELVERYATATHQERSIMSDTIKLLTGLPLHTIIAEVDDEPVGEIPEGLGCPQSLPEN